MAGEIELIAKIKPKNNAFPSIVDASLVGIEDSAGKFAATTVEEALAALADGTVLDSRYLNLDSRWADITATGTVDGGDEYGVLSLKVQRGAAGTLIDAITIDSGSSFVSPTAAMPFDTTVGSLATGNINSYDYGQPTGLLTVYGALISVYNTEPSVGYSASVEFLLANNSTYQTFGTVVCTAREQDTSSDRWGEMSIGAQAGTSEFDGVIVSGGLSTGEDPAVYLGGNKTNAVKIAEDGELTLEGTATRFDDLRVEPVARTTGDNSPTFEKWFDDAAGTSRGVYLYSFDDAAGGSEKEVFFTMQMPHNWKEGSDIYLHIHWVGAVNDTTSAPRWGLEYTWKDIGEVYGDTTIVYSDGSNYVPGGTEADITAHKHYISKFATITPGATQDGISGIIIGRIFRDSANAGDTYNAAGAKCGMLYIDAHYEIDSMGSASEYTK